MNVILCSVFFSTDYLNHNFLGAGFCCCILLVLVALAIGLGGWYASKGGDDGDNGKNKKFLDKNLSCVFCQKVCDDNFLIFISSISNFVNCLNFFVRKKKLKNLRKVSQSKNKNMAHSFLFLITRTFLSLKNYFIKIQTFMISF